MKSDADSGRCISKARSTRSMGQIAVAQIAIEESTTAARAAGWSESRIPPMKASSKDTVFMAKRSGRGLRIIVMIRIIARFHFFNAYRKNIAKT